MPTGLDIFSEEVGADVAPPIATYPEPLPLPRPPATAAPSTGLDIFAEEAGVRFEPQLQASHLSPQGFEQVQESLAPSHAPFSESRPGLLGRVQDTGYDVVAGISNLGKMASAPLRVTSIMSDPQGEAEKILAGERSFLSRFRDTSAATSSEQFGQSREQQEDTGKRMISNAIRSGIPSGVMTLGAAAATRGRGNALTAAGAGATSVIQAADAMVDRFEENIRNKVETKVALADAIMTFGAEAGAEFIGNYLQIKSLNGILNQQAIGKLSKIKDLLGKRNPASAAQAEKLLAELGPFKAWFQKSLLPTVAKTLFVAGTEGVEEGATEVAERGISKLTGAPREPAPLPEVMGTGAIAGGGMAAVNIPVEVRQNKKIMTTLADANADPASRYAAANYVTTEMKSRGAEREAKVLGRTWEAAINKGRAIDLESTGIDETDPRGQLPSPASLAARTAEIRTNEDAMREKTPAKPAGGPRVASTSTEDLTAFLKQHAPTSDPDALALVSKKELKPHQVKAQEEDAQVGLVTVFYRGANGEGLAALSGGPGVSFVPADLNASDTAFKARHEKAHALDARAELDPLTEVTRTRIAQAVTGPDYAGHAQDLELRRAEASLPAATPAQEFDELAADVRAPLYGAKGKTAAVKRSSLDGWVQQVAEADPGRFQRMKDALATYANKVGLRIPIPDRSRGTVEQWAAVADAAITEVEAAKTIPQKAARRSLLSILGQVQDRMGTPAATAAGAPRDQQRVKDVTSPAPAFGARKAAAAREFAKGQGKDAFGKPAGFRLGEIVRHTSDGEEYRVVELTDSPHFVRVQKGKEFPVLTAVENLTRTIAREGGPGRRQAPPREVEPAKSPARMDIEARGRSLGIVDPGDLSDLDLRDEISARLKARKAGQAPPVEPPPAPPVRPTGQRSAPPPAATPRKEPIAAAGPVLAAKGAKDASVPEFAPGAALAKTERTLANGNYFSVIERTGAAGKFAKGGIIVQPYKNHQTEGRPRQMSLAEARALRHFTEDDLVDISRAMDREEGFSSSGVSNLQSEIRRTGGINPDLARRELKDKMLDLKAAPGVFNKKSRNSPDDMAEQLGYESADALMDALRDELETGRPQFYLGVKGEAPFSLESTASGAYSSDRGESDERAQEALPGRVGEVRGQGQASEENRDLFGDIQPELFEITPGTKSILEVDPRRLSKLPEEARFSGDDRPTFVLRGQKITSGEDVAHLFRNHTRYDREVFWIARQHRSGETSVEVISVGCLTGSLVHPREVFKNSIREDVSEVWLVHNHPSGNMAPSPEDIQLTERLVEAGKIAGVEVRGHVIIDGDRYSEWTNGGGTTVASNANWSGAIPFSYAAAKSERPAREVLPGTRRLPQNNKYARTISTSREAARYAMNDLRGVERPHVLILDARNAVLEALALEQDGDLQGQVFRFAAANDAAAVIVAGPRSWASAHGTGKTIDAMAEAGKVMGIRLLDVIAVDPGGYQSYMDQPAGSDYGASWFAKEPRRLFGKSKAEEVPFSLPSGQKFRPVVSLAGTELGDYGGDLKSLRAAARDWYRQRLQHGDPASRNDLGKIAFTRRGLREFEHFGADPAKMKMVVALRQIIEQGEYKGQKDLEHGRRDAIVRFHSIDADVLLEGRKYRVRALVGEDLDGNKFFDLFPNIEEYETKKASRGFATGRPSTGPPEGLSESVAAPDQNIAPADKDVKSEAPKSLANAHTTPAAHDPQGASRVSRAFSGRGLSVLRAAEHALKYWPAGGKPAEDIISAIPEGRQYLQRVERAWWETRRRIASWAHPLNVARRGLDRADRHYIRTRFLRDYEDGGADQTWRSPAVAEFARAWRDVNTTIAEEVGETIESFTGRDPDTYVPHRLTDKGRAVLQQKSGPEWDALVEAAKVAGIDIHVLEGLRQDPLRQQKYGSIDYARIANLPWEVTTEAGKVVKILETDPEVLFSHVRGAARRISTIEEFGADESSSEYLDQVATGLVSSGALDSESTREAVARIWKRLEGQDAMAGRELFGKAHDLWQAVDSVVAALNLSGAVIGNLVGGHLPETVRMGFVPTMRAFKDAYTTSLSNASLEDLHALADLEGDLLHDLQSTETLEGRVAKGAGKVLAATGFVAVNRRINLAVAMAMQRQHLRLMLERVASGKISGKLWGQDAGAARRYLVEELKFSDEEFTDPKTGKVTPSDIERMILEGPTDQDMARAIGKQLELVNAMNESPGSRPRWVAHPIWRMGFAYSTFVRKMWDTTKFATREAAAGNVRPLATLLVSGAVTAEIMAAIKDLLKDREKEDRGFLERLANDMVEIGALGLAGAWKYGIMRLGDPQASLWDDVTKPPHIETFDALFVSGPGRALAQKSFKPLWKNAAGVAPAVDIFDKQATKSGLFGKDYTERDYAERLVNKVYLRDRAGKPGVTSREALDPIPSKHKDNTSRELVERLRKTHSDSVILQMIRDAKDRREGTQ